MKKETIATTLFILLFILFAVIVTVYLGWPYKYFLETSNKICIEDKACFYAEIADTLSEREKGLSGRQTLGNDKGMLFIFESETIPGFWMKDMNFPLDIIWIDNNMKIVGIEKTLGPCEEGKECPVIYPDKQIKYVLEIKSGLSDIYGFEEGNSVFFR